jgi:glycosyltransferase involved in cell wall biosynthesis
VITNERGERLSLSVILPTYNEADSIRACISGFEKLGIVDEIIVINNNAHPDTTGQVAGTSAIEIFETQQGYGAAIQRGLREAKSDLLAVCEPDGTFEPADILKLLPFLSDCSFVVGSRTVSDFIYTGANMGRFLRWGNWAVAKLTEVVYGSAYLSDVGCTFRVLTRESYEEIAPEFKNAGSSFGFEMLLLAIRKRIGVVQVPVRYYPRVGVSSVTGSRAKAVRLGLSMIMLMFRMRTGRK